MSAASDFLREYAADVDTYDSPRKDSQHIHCLKRRTLKAFTIADMFRLVRYEKGIITSRPNHRVYESIDSQWSVIYPCLSELKPLDGIAKIQQLAWEQYQRAHS